MTEVDGGMLTDLARELLAGPNFALPVPDQGGQPGPAGDAAGRVEVEHMPTR